VISVDDAKIFKVDPKPYELVKKRTGVASDKVCFLSSNCWDAHGAAQFGFRVLWVNRGGLPEDNLPGKIVAQIKDLSLLPSQLGVS
jgi:2-haloacid dehalogenase